MLLTVLTECGRYLEGKYSCEEAFQTLMVKVSTHVHTSGSSDGKNRIEQFIF